MEGDLQPLLDAFDSGPALYSIRAANERFGAAVAWAEAVGLLVRAHNLPTVRCPECPDAAELPLEFDASRRAWVYHCNESGWRVADPTDVEAYRLVSDALPGLLAAALGLPAMRVRERAPGVLWELGDAEIGGRPWTACLAKGIGDHAAMSSALEALEERVHRERGLIFTATDVRWRPRLPYGHRFAEITDVFAAAPTGLAANEDSLAKLLGHIAPAIGRPGRPSSKAASLEMFRRRIEGRQAIASSLNEEARAIAAALEKNSNIRPLPAAATVEKHIRTEYNEWIYMHH